MNSLPPLRVVIGLVGDTSTRATIARIEPDLQRRLSLLLFTPTKLSQVACDAFQLRKQYL